MVLVSLNKILKEAQRCGYAVGYFESWNLESTRAAVKAAEEERAPVIIGFNGSFLAVRRRDLESYASMGKLLAAKASVPVSLLLNEASDFQQIVQGIRFGFSSVMIDGSFLPFEKNVNLTRKIVEVCHSVDVSVEGQMDELPHAKDGVFHGDIKDFLTDTEKVASFVRETDIDALSVSVGNIHVLYKEKAKIDFTRLKKIKELIDIPLVIHGATGISDNDIQKMIKLGVFKINIGTELRLNFINGLSKAVGKSIITDPEEILDFAEQEMKDLIRKKMKIYGCSSRT